MDEEEMRIASPDRGDGIVKKILKAAGSADDSEVKNPPTCNKPGSSNDVQLILLGMGMEKYNDLFANANITLGTFLKLDASDLVELGITDSNDIETIMKNLQIYEAKTKKLVVPENSLDDLQIARNVKNELVLLQHYCSYLELQMRKHKMTDYRINWKESASTYLKAFTETALLQAKNLSQRVYCNYGDNHLIGKALKLNNLTLSTDLKEKLKSEKPKKRKRKQILCIIVVLGALAVAGVVGYSS